MTTLYPTQTLVTPLLIRSHLWKCIPIPATAYAAPHLILPHLRVGGPVSPTKAWRLLRVQAKDINCTTEYLMLWFWMNHGFTQDTTIDKIIYALPYIVGDSIIIKECSPACDPPYHRLTPHPTYTFHFCPPFCPAFIPESKSRANPPPWIISGIAPGHGLSTRHFPGVNLAPLAPENSLYLPHHRIIRPLVNLVVSCGIQGLYSSFSYWV